MKKWLQNAVFYEIYPQSFNDTNGDGIGDFEGIIEKLDYIKDMGFNAIWMNPCFASPFTDAGYDIEDFYKAAPRYGTNDDLKRLFDEAHKRGLHVILDLVAGHTAHTCKWFLESMKPEKNEYTDRYIWTNFVWGDIGNITSVKGWLRGLSQREGCCGVNFFNTQPALNYGFANPTADWQLPVDSPAAIATRDELINVIRFWLDKGCDGFRVDMAGSLVKNDVDFSATVKLWQSIFKIVNAEYPDAAFVSEWSDPEKALPAGFDMDFMLPFGPTGEASHYADMFHSENAYFSADERGTAAEFMKFYLRNLAKANGNGMICIPSGNHDMPRVAYYLDTAQLKLAYAFIMSMPGVPFIYYGDEIGMRYIENIISVEGGYERTGARSPMQWDNSKNCGFSTADEDKLYICMDKSASRPTVEDQMKDENSVLNELKRLIKIRKAMPALQENAAIETVCVDGYPLIYKRSAGDTTILVCINPSAKEKTCKLSGKLGKVIYENNGAATLAGETLTVPACSASFIELGE